MQLWILDAAKGKYPFFLSEAFRLINTKHSEIILEKMDDLFGKYNCKYEIIEQVGYAI